MGKRRIWRFICLAVLSLFLGEQARTLLFTQSLIISSSFFSSSSETSAIEDRHEESSTTSLLKSQMREDSNFYAWPQQEDDVFKAIELKGHRFGVSIQDQQSAMVKEEGGSKNHNQIIQQPSIISSTKRPSVNLPAKDSLQLSPLTMISSQSILQLNMPSGGETFWQAPIL